MLHEVILMLLFLPQRWLSVWQLRIHASERMEQTQDRASYAASSASSNSISDFERFFWQYEPQLSRYLWHMTGDEQRAHDLCQDAFIRAWQHFGEIQHYKHPQAWLFRVATNLALTSQRQTLQIQAVAIDDDHPLTQGDLGSRIADRELIAQALQSLSPRSRSALLLQVEQGFSCAEIGKLLGMKVSAVKTALSRAREQFRTRYLQEGGEL
jgi:RNA polymerase sigma factor (sigma-70 family)